MSADARRVLAFAALAGFAAHHWSLLVVGTEPWRWAVCVAIGAAGAVGLILLRGHPPARAAAGGAALFLAMLVGGVLTIGVPIASLLPGPGDDLGAQLSGGLTGVSEIDTPYDGPNQWTRIGVLAAIPLAVSLAMAAAFWPLGEGRLGRAAGLAMLLLLYATSVTWEAPGAELVRGAALFALVAAVLWLPGLPRSRAAAALATVALAAAVAFPLASRVDASDPLVSYTDWQVFGAEAGINFNWNHTYGKLDWPQEGTEVFVASSDGPLYWKTYVLDEFEGDAWTRSSDGFGEVASEYYLAGADLEDVENHPEWVREFEIELSGLRSRYAVTAGAPRELDGIEILGRSGDGTSTAEDTEIPAGSTYTVEAYVPDPTPRQLRTAAGAHPPAAARYTSLGLARPAPLEEGSGQTQIVASAAVPPTGISEQPDERELLDSELPIDDAVSGTPYERVLKLARAVTQGARTDYAAVSRVQRFLAANYTYDQTVPLSEDPLVAFLFRDRAGYCQQFSGAMALMLRMVGIPARVVSGFAPGIPQSGGSYAVSDTDAHSWVEVLYPGIGWVTVDPTPGETPAHTNIRDLGSGGGGQVLDRALGRVFPNGDGSGEGRRGADPVPASAEEDGGSPAPLLAFLALAGTGTGVMVRRRRRLRSPAGAELQLRELAEALRATGQAAPPGATLLAIQGQLGRAVGPEAARYAAALRESRYGRRRRRRPGSAERRSFRWALARRSGVFGWWKALRAVPPGGPRA